MKSASHFSHTVFYFSSLLLKQTTPSLPYTSTVNHSLLLVDTGSCPVQPQSYTGGHWELPSTTTVSYWWTLGAAQYNHSLLLVDTGSCPVQPQSPTGGRWELRSITTVLYGWTLGAAQYNHSLLLVDTISVPPPHFFLDSIILFIEACAHALLPCCHQRAPEEDFLSLT